jgi:myo-inositol-1-phosphate synthase
MDQIRVAIAGLGNCASSLIQGVEYYKSLGDDHPDRALGLMHYDLGGYRPADIRFVAAFDIDRRKVGRSLREAVFAKPNCTKVFYKDIPDFPVTVMMGNVLDGISKHMVDYPDDRRFIVAKKKPCDVMKVLRDSSADILLNYLPVGSEQATAFYAEICLESGVSLINCVPVFIASDKSWAGRFEKRMIMVIG